MSKEATSRSLDYTLDSQILDRVKEANKVRRPDTTIGEAISDVGTSIYEGAKKKKEFSEASNMAWDTAFAKMGDRGEWASPELFDQFQQMEQGYKQEYLDAVNRNDTAAMAVALQKQGQRASALTGWKDVMETAKEIENTHGWGTLITDNEENKAILTALAANDGSAKLLEQDGEMVFEITLPGDAGKRIVTRREIDEMVANGTKPIKRQEDWFNTLDADEQRGYQGLSFNPERAIASAKNKINSPDVLKSYMDDPFAGATSFSEDFLAGDHDFDPTGAADLEGGQLQTMEESDLPANVLGGDDGIVGDDPNTTKDESKDDIVDPQAKAKAILAYFRTPEGFQDGKTEVAAWMAAKRHQIWKGGHDNWVVRTTKTEGNDRSKGE